ncbi:MAG: hypothetical protein IT426_13645 [Pirellulales bacterium]|nr:hypothetical protein [Pirellulales bacterium]
MIRIDLVDKTSKLKHIDFQVVPVTNEKDFICTPDGILPLRSVVRLSRQLEAGRVSGQFGEFVWYRLLGTPQDRRLEPLGIEV